MGPTSRRWLAHYSLPVLCKVAPTEVSAKARHPRLLKSTRRVNHTSRTKQPFLHLEYVRLSWDIYRENTRFQDFSSLDGRGLPFYQTLKIIFLGRVMVYEI